MSSPSPTDAPTNFTTPTPSKAAVRIIVALLSLLFRFGGESYVVEAISAFWLPYLIMNVEFAAISVILLVWLDILKTSKMDKKFRRRPFLIFLIVLNVVLNVATILALAIISPFGDSEPRLQSNIDMVVSLHAAQRKFNFRVSYFAFASFFFLILIGGFIYVYVNLRKSFKVSNLNAQNEMVSKKKRAFLRKTEGFIIAILILFLIRLILDVVIVFLTLEEVLLRTAQFIWHVVPEIVLICVFIWVAWVKRGDTGSDDATAKTAGGSTKGTSQDRPKKGKVNLQVRSDAAYTTNASVTTKGNTTVAADSVNSTNSANPVDSLVSAKVDQSSTSSSSSSQQKPREESESEEKKPSAEESDKSSSSVSSSVSGSASPEASPSPSASASGSASISASGSGSGSGSGSSS